MELRHWRAFVAAGEELNFTRAAARCQTSQQNLSKLIAHLERDLGVALFERGHALALTPTGQRLLPGIRAVLAELDGHVRAARNPAPQVLRVGFPEYVNHGPVPGWLHAFAAHHPGVRLVEHELYRVELLPALLAGELDVCFVQAPVEDARLRTQLIWRSPLWVLLPDTHPLAGHDRIPTRALDGQPFLLPARDISPAYHDCLVAHFEQVGARPAWRVEGLYSTNMYVRKVLEGEGLYTVLPGRPVPTPGVVKRPLTDPPLTMDVAAVWRASRETPVLTALLGWLEHDLPGR